MKDFNLNNCVERIAWLERHYQQILAEMDQRFDALTETVDMLESRINYLR